MVDRVSRHVWWILLSRAAESLLASSSVPFIPFQRQVGERTFISVAETTALLVSTCIRPGYSMARIIYAIWGNVLCSRAPIISVVPSQPVVVRKEESIFLLSLVTKETRIRKIRISSRDKYRGLFLHYIALHYTRCTFTCETIYRLPFFNTGILRVVISKITNLEMEIISWVYVCATHD